MSRLRVLLGAAVSSFLFLGLAIAQTSVAAASESSNVAPDTADGEAGEWTTYRGNPSRTGVATSAGPTGEPTVLWEFQTDGPVRDEPAVVDGTVYIGSNDGHLYALDAATGQEGWTFAMTGMDSTPAVADGIVYVGSADGTLYALDGESGSAVWSVPGVRADAYPAVVDGVVYTGSNDGQLYALDAGDGSKLWSSSLGALSSRSMAVVDGVVYIGSADSRLHAVDTSSGTALWDVEFGDGVIATPVVSDGAVYEAVFESSSDNALHAIDAATGEERWQFATETGANVWAPTVADDTVYVVSNDGSIYALDAATGDEQWRVGTSGPIEAGTTLAGDIAYSADLLGGLYAIDTTNGTELWHLSIGGGAEHGPAVVDGVAYVGTLAGNVVAVGSGTGNAVAADVSVASTSTEGSGVPASVAESEEFPDGVYELEVTEDELIAHGATPDFGLWFAGVNTMTFDDGMWTLLDAGGCCPDEPPNTYTVDGDQISVVHWQGFVLFEASWTLDGDQLEFTDITVGEDEFTDLFEWFWAGRGPESVTPRRTQPLRNRRHQPTATKTDLPAVWRRTGRVAIESPRPGAPPRRAPIDSPVGSTGADATGQVGKRQVGVRDVRSIPTMAHQGPSRRCRSVALAPGTRASFGDDVRYGPAERAVAWLAQAAGAAVPYLR